ncbi:unnamed protein product [Lactuca saligna]|uniref:glycine--tRNA ligase n=1 Tax=Lactuca saligna TaxID=75948 RepID=A0AA35Z4Y2_LACSI|nr:unnamed protein product [Lactuca saligna]
MGKKRKHEVKDREEILRPRGGCIGAVVLFLSSRWYGFTLIWFREVISGKILQLESVTQSEAMRRRYRYLSHFSLTTTFQLPIPPLMKTLVGPTPSLRKLMFTSLASRNSEFCNQFYRAYFVLIVQEIFDVMTDSFHKLGFNLHMLVLQHLFCLVESRSLTEPLWDTSTISYPYPNNGMFVRDRESTLLSFLVPLFQIFQHLRLDSLVGLFGAGCQPSSTNDPFGLPRISYGLVQVLVEKDRNLDLQHALEVDASVKSLKIDVVTICEVVGKVLPELNGKLTGMDFRVHGLMGLTNQRFLRYVPQLPLIQARCSQLVGHQIF